MECLTEAPRVVLPRSVVEQWSACEILGRGPAIDAARVSCVRMNAAAWCFDTLRVTKFVRSHGSHGRQAGHSITSVSRVHSCPSRLYPLVAVQLLSHKVDSSRVAKGTQSADDTDSLVAQVAAVSELLPSMDVADVHLYKGDRHSR